jgi:hypothetical protein
MELPWLELDGGIWRLLTANATPSIRTWTDREPALTEPAGNGWRIDRPCPKRLRAQVRANLGCRGQALTRTVHCPDNS